MHTQFNFTPKSWGLGIEIEFPSTSQRPYWGFMTYAPAGIIILFAAWSFEIWFGEYRYDDEQSQDLARPKMK